MTLTPMTTNLIRVAEVQRRTASANRVWIYHLVRQGVMTAPVKIAERCSAWPEHEVDAIIAARIRGDSTEAIKALVEQLHAARKSFGLQSADMITDVHEEEVR